MTVVLWTLLASVVAVPGVLAVAAVMAGEDDDDLDDCRAALEERPPPSERRKRVKRIRHRSNKRKRGW